MDENKKPKPWVTIYDEYGDQCGTLAGDKKGLLWIKEKIDEAISKGEAEVDGDIDSDFAIVKILETNPYGVEKEETLKDKALKYGCLSVLVIAFLIFCIGAKSLLDMLFG